MLWNFFFFFFTAVFIQYVGKELFGKVLLLINLKMAPPEPDKPI